MCARARVLRRSATQQCVELLHLQTDVETDVINLHTNMLFTVDLM